MTVWCLERVQTRESAALRETLQVEREASSAELEALRATIHKLEGEIRQRPPPRPAVSEEEAEERRRAGEKSTQEILQLKKVLLHAWDVAALSFVPAGVHGSSWFPRSSRSSRPFRQRRRLRAERRRSSRLACLSSRKKRTVRSTYLWGHQRSGCCITERTQPG